MLKSIKTRNEITDIAQRLEGYSDKGIGFEIIYAINDCNSDEKTDVYSHWNLRLDSYAKDKKELTSAEKSTELCEIITRLKGYGKNVFLTDSALIDCDCWNIKCSHYEVTDDKDTKEE